MPVPQLPGLWQEEVRLHLRGDSAGLSAPCPRLGGLAAGGGGRGAGPLTLIELRCCRNVSSVSLLGKKSFPSFSWESCYLKVFLKTITVCFTGMFGDFHGPYIPVFSWFMPGMME